MAEEKEIVPVGFAAHQVDACELTPDPPPVKEICKECEPDPSFIEPDWRLQVEKPYFNAKTCEYMVTVIVNKHGDSYSLGNSDPNLDFRKYQTDEQRERLFRSYTQPALVLLLGHFNKMIADQIICAYHNGPTLNGKTPEELLTNYGDYKTVFDLLKDEPVNTERSYPDATPCLDYTKPVDEITEVEAEGSLMSLTDIIIKAKSEYPDITNPYALELYTFAKDFWIDPTTNILKVLVAIPAFIFNAVPPAPTTDDIDEESENMKEEVVLKVEKLWGQIQRVSVAFDVYSKYQAYFWQSQQGSLVFKDSQVGYYASNYSSRLEAFYKDLKAITAHEGWNIRSATPSLSKLNARLIKIEFEKIEEPPKITEENIEEFKEDLAAEMATNLETTEEETPEEISHHYKIKSIKLKKRGCNYTKLKGDPAKKFIEDYNKKPTVLGYIAKLNEIDVDLQAKKSYPWLDFIMKYTYPKLVINYGRLSKEDVEKTAGTCIADNISAFGEELQDYILNQALSLLDVFQYEWNSKGCVSFQCYDEEPEAEFFTGKKSPKGKEARKEEEENFKDEELISALEKEQTALYAASDRLSAQRGAYVQEKRKAQGYIDLMVSQYGMSSATVNSIAPKKQIIKQMDSKIQEIDNLLSQAQEKNEEITSKLDSKRKRKKDLRKRRASAAKEARKNRRNEEHPYMAEAKKLAYAEFGVQDNLLASLIGVDQFTKKKELSGEDLENEDAEDLKKLSRRLSLCNMQSLMLQGVRCLMSGVEEEAALKKIIKSTLQSLDIDVFGYFVHSLPAEAQAELRKKMEKQFKGLPLPWDEGYDAGSLDNTNPYTKRLRTPTERLQDKQSSTAAKAEMAQRKADDKDYDAESGDLVVYAMDEQIAAYDEQIVSHQQRITRIKEQLDRDVILYDDVDQLPRKRKAENEIEEINTEIERLSNLMDDLERDKRQLERQQTRQAKRSVRADEKVTELETKWAQLSSEEQIQAAANASEASRVSLGGDPDNKGSQGTYGTALGNVQELIVDAYIEWILDIVQYDQLMTILDGFPEQMWYLF